MSKINYKYIKNEEAIRRMKHSLRLARIESELMRGIDRIPNNKSPKQVLSELLENGYPDDEAKRFLTNKFKSLKKEENLIDEWIKDLKKEIDKKNRLKEKRIKSKEVLDER